MLLRLGYALACAWAFAMAALAVRLAWPGALPGPTGTSVLAGMGAGVALAAVAAG